MLDYLHPVGTCCKDADGYVLHGMHMSLMMAGAERRGREEVLLACAIQHGCPLSKLMQKIR